MEWTGIPTLCTLSSWWIGICLLEHRVIGHGASSKRWTAFFIWCVELGLSSWRMKAFVSSSHSIFVTWWAYKLQTPPLAVFASENSKTAISSSWQSVSGLLNLLEISLMSTYGWEQKSATVFRDEISCGVWNTCHSLIWGFEEMNATGSGWNCMEKPFCSHVAVLVFDIDTLR